MSEVSLKSIDELIEEADKYNSSEEYLTKLAEKIALFLKIETNGEKLDSKFLTNRQLDHNDKRFIAFSLLRVYSNNPNIIIRSSSKHNIHNIILQSLASNINSLNIKEKSETYEIETKLSGFVKSIEKEIDEKFAAKIDLHFIEVFGNTYRSTFRKSGCKELFYQFFGKKAVWQLFDKVFIIVKEYNESDSKQKFILYHDALKLIDSIIEHSDEIDTRYSKNYIKLPFTKIREMLVEDFKNNPFSKPALLTIKKTEKKYPFIKNVNQKIQLLIENESFGYADNCIVKINLYSDESIRLKQLEQYVGLIKKSSIIEFEYDGVTNSESVVIFGQIDWTNFDHEKVSLDFELELIGQNLNIDWSEFEKERPYDLEPVTDENEFIGRKKIIDDLRRINNKVTSSYIFGQRRVGKTSIVKTLQSTIKDKNVLVIYIEAGDWDNASSPHKSMGDLGEIICENIKKSNEKFASLKTPDFDGSFNRLTKFLDEVSSIDKKFQTLIILDEFDRISSELLYQSDIARSFMLTIRSISNRDQFGFILVGGEKLEYLLSQWQEFNKFKPIRVDYFDKKEEWEDFKNLIKFPVSGILEISDQAIDYIYSQTSGNPYFTKKICIELFDFMISNRDNHVTDNETRKATEIARNKNNIGATDFSHFWKDGIKEKGDKEDEISINRRKVLLSIGQILNTVTDTNKQKIIDKSVANGLDELQAEKTLDEFVQRKILKVDNNSYSFIVKFFEDWLISNGLDLIITTFKEEQKITLRKRYEDELTIKHDEINSLSQGWKTYKGREITTDIIREWLQQFEDLESQRLVFKMLENVKLYSNYEIREKLEELFGEVKKEIRKADENYVSKKGSERKQSGILVSYLDDNPAKSGPEYAKIFVEANNLYKDNSIIPEKIGKRISDLKNINAIVFIDDILGTGDSIIENLEPLISQYENEFIERNILIIIGFITGFQEAKHKVEAYFEKYDLKVIFKILVPLDNKDRCFSSDSLIYSKPIEREKAKSICLKFGNLLVKSNPLGYGNCQATIVFPNTCPNNTLPIFWKENSSWKPLFKRG